jgi:hypothetical protein
MIYFNQNLTMDRNYISVLRCLMIFWVLLIAGCTQSAERTLQHSREMIERGEVEEAMVLLDQIIEANPDSAQAYFWLGRYQVGQPH